MEKRSRSVHPSRPVRGLARSTVSISSRAQVDTRLGILWAVGVAAFLALLVAVAYWPSRSGPFVYDDRVHIVENSAVHLRDLSARGVWHAAFHRINSVAAPRPIANLTFALNYRIGGLSSFGYHVVNALIHFSSAMGVFMLFLITVPLLARKPIGRSHLVIVLPLMAAVWALHPVHSQAVAYIVQRMTALCGAFYLWAMVCYFRSRTVPAPRSRLFLTISFFLYLSSLATKELAISFPLVLFVSEVLIFKATILSAMRRLIPWCVPVVAVLYVSSEFRDALAQLGLSLGSGVVVSSRKDLGTEFSAFERWITQTRVLWYYVSLIILPLPGRLGLHHDIQVSTALTRPLTTGVSLAALLASIFLAIRLCRRWPAVSFGWIFFLLASSIEMLHPQLALVYEHRLYLPSVGLMLILQSILLSAPLRPWSQSLLVIPVLALTAGTFERSKIWASAYTLWQDTVEKAPRTPVAHYNLGVELFQQGQIEGAVYHYTEVLRINPDHADAHNNLGFALFEQGQVDQAVVHYTQALRVNPDHADAHNNLGIVLIYRDQIEDAIVHFSEAVRINPGYAKAHNNLGGALAKQGRFEEAIVHFSEAVRIDPGYAKAHNNLGGALVKQGRFEDAIVHFSEALRIDPDLADTRYNLELARGLGAAQR